MSPGPFRPLQATWDMRAGEWTPQIMKDCALKAVQMGFSRVQLNYEWATLQSQNTENVELGQVDWAIKVARACGLEVALGIDHSAPPAWVDKNEFCVRDEGGKLVVAGPNNTPMMAQNSKQVREWVADFLRFLAGRFGDSARYIQGISTPVGESTWRHPSKKMFDHSKWASEAYRSWIRARYVDIRTLNAAWDCNYRGWEEVQVGEGPRKATMADFHAFRYFTLSSWTDYMRKAVREIKPTNAWAFRIGAARLEKDMQQLSFDFGRYAKFADLLIADGAWDQFVINMVRSAAEINGKPWGIRLDSSVLEKGISPQQVNIELYKWGKSVYDLGGFVDIENFVRFTGQAVPGPEDWTDTKKWSFVPEMQRLARGPVPQPKNNRRAVFVSAAEIQYSDGTDYEAARNRWMQVCDSGKKPQYDVVSDGMFVASPDVLKRYTAGVEVPFAKVISKDTRGALIQAMGLGVRVAVEKPAFAGSIDEHGKPQTQLIAQ